MLRSFIRAGRATFRRLIKPQEPDAARARRSAMLQRFRRAARFALRPVFGFYKARGSRGRVKDTGGGRAAKRAASFLAAFLRGSKTGAAYASRIRAAKQPKRPPKGKTFLRQRAPPRTP
jgi:hypothetical protein